MGILTARNLLLLLLALLGLEALGGGVLIVSPSGKLIGMPLAVLAGSPFHSFLLPGLLLFTVLGVAPGLLEVALLKKPASQLAERLNGVLVQRGEKLR